MQRCPKCNRTYQDDSQKFCTFDGGRLMVDSEAPTAFDLGPEPQADPLGATVMGTAPDLNKTVAGAMPPLTSEISPPAPTGPAISSAPTWHDAPPNSNAPPPAAPPAPTGPTTTSPLTTPPAGTTPPTAPASSTIAASGGLSPTAPVAAPQPHPGTNPSAPQSGTLGAAPATTAPRPKSNRILLLIGGLAVLFLLVIAGGAGFYFFVMKPTTETSNSGGGGSPTLEKDSNTANTNANANSNTGNANTGAVASQPPVTAPPNSTKFVNSRDKLTGSLAEHFVDFSLYYPNSWTIDPKAGTSGSTNFFKADRMLRDDTGDYLLESAAISWYQSNGTMQLDRPIFPNRVEFFNNLFAKDYPNYQKVTEGETRFNGLDAYQFTFKSLVKGTGKGDINLWGRVIFLPLGTEDARNGVVLLMLASSAASEITSMGDVGEKGELPTILKTFRLGS
ncbi:MAG TPA: hypothetical protein VGC66_16115 [Pyrinomonadaceae bacterium]|jgi:hypothetical protein